MKSTGNWRKSSRSGANGACVEARMKAGVQQVRDSKLGDDSPVMSGFGALRDTILAGRV